MKILHTADWHLGKRLEQFSILEEDNMVLTEVGISSCATLESKNFERVKRGSKNVFYTDHYFPDFIGCKKLGKTILIEKRWSSL